MTPALEITDAPHKLILLGQAATRHADPGVALIAGRAGITLSHLAGVNLIEFLRLVKPVNLLPDWEGPGDFLPMDQAGRSADALLPLLRGRRVILLGRAVGRAFGLKKYEMLWAGYHRGFEATLFPHPGGLPRWWSDPENERRASHALKCELAAARSARIVSRNTGDSCPH